MRPVKVMDKTFGHNLKSITEAILGLDEAGLLRMKAELKQGWVAPTNECNVWLKRISSTTVKTADGEFNLIPEQLVIKHTVHKETSMFSVFSAFFNPSYMSVSLRVHPKRHRTCKGNYRSSGTPTEYA
jgi:hypothetical protein